MDLQDSFVKNLEVVLALRGWSQKKLADKLGVTKAQVNHWLHKRSSPRLSTVERIAKHLRVKPQDLLEKRRKPYKKKRQTA